MFLALPVLYALVLIWLDGALPNMFKKHRFVSPTIRALIFCGLVTLACFRNSALLNPPSPLINNTRPLTVASIDSLAADALAVADICQKYNATLVIPSSGAGTCFNEAGPLLARGRFETLYPPFERRTFRIAEEQSRMHTNVLIYRPSFFQIAMARGRFPRASIVCKSPELLLIRIDEPGMPALEIAKTIGLKYQPKF